MHLIVKDTQTIHGDGLIAELDELINRGKTIQDNINKDIMYINEVMLKKLEDSLKMWKAKL